MIIFFERAGYYIIEKKDNTELSENVFLDFEAMFVEHYMFGEELVEGDERRIEYPIPRNEAKATVMKSLILSMILSLKKEYENTIDMFEDDE